MLGSTIPVLQKGHSNVLSEWFLLELTFDLLCRMRAESSLFDSPITPAWSLASHHSTKRSTNLIFFPSCSAASAIGKKANHKGMNHW